MRGLLDNKILPPARSQSLNKVRTLSLSVVFFAVSLLGVFFTTYDFVFFILGALSLLGFVAGKLINKSLSETQNQFNETDTLLLSLKKAQHELAQTKYMSKVSSLGEKAHAQSLALEELWKQLKMVIETKFSSAEITYSRYMNASSESVHLILQNFTLLSETLKAVELSTSEASQQKTLALELLSSNQSALDQLLALKKGLTLINAGGSTDSLMEQSIEELKRLSEQAKKYSK